MSVEADEIWAILRGIAESQKKTDEQLKQLFERVDCLEIQLGSLREITPDYFFDNEEENVDKFFYDYFTKNNASLDSLNFNAFEMSDSGKIRLKLVDENGKNIVAITTKFKIKKEDVDDFTNKLFHFKQSQTVYKDYKLYGAVASFHINDEAKETALNRGFFVLQQTGKVVQTDYAENLLVL